MEMDALFAKTEERMEKSINSLNHELGTISAGRAAPSLLDKITVDYYGVPTPINSMAAISVTESRVLTVQPWDAGTLREIEKAIQTSDLGINPQNDGRVIRLTFPQPTEERRRELVKTVKQKGEDSKVAVRSVRRDGMERLKNMKKDSAITEDDLKDGEKRLQEITDKFTKEIDSIAAKKEKEVLEI